MNRTLGEYLIALMTGSIITVDAIGFAATRTVAGEGVAALCVAVLAVMAHRWRQSA